MPIVLITCIVMVVATAGLHYEVLRWLDRRLRSLRIPLRTKLLVAILVAFVAHGVEIVLYGLAVHALVTWGGVGTLSGPLGVSLSTALYFSAETYTSLGFGDIAPLGPIRLLAGVEALNGLLLIGWSASFLHIAMDRFWRADTVPRSL